MSLSPAPLSPGAAYRFIELEAVQRQTRAPAEPVRSPGPASRRGRVVPGSTVRRDIIGLSAGSERATVLIPRRLLRTEEVEALLWLHGHHLRYSESEGREEMAWVEQQVEASGRPTLGILPHGTEGSGFSRRPEQGGPAGFDSQAYVSEVLAKLVELGVWERAPRLTGVVVSGHSGAGAAISEMMVGRGAARLPPMPSLMEVNLFDAINGAEQEQRVQAWVLRQLDQDGNALTAPFMDPAAQAEYLAGGIRFRAYHTRNGHFYLDTHEQLDTAIASWFATNADQLGGPRSPVLRELRRHYQVIDTGDDTDGAHNRLVGIHGPATGSRDLLLEALGELPAEGRAVGPVVGPPLSRMAIDGSAGRFAVQVIAALQRTAGNAAVAVLLQRQAPAAAGGAPAGVQEFVTPIGHFRRYPAGGHRSNSADRPLFPTPDSALRPYVGAGASGNQRVHPAMVPNLERLMTALIAEGERINDESMRQAVVASAYRPPSVAEGQLYLSALQKTMTENREFAGRALTPELEAQAQEELGPVGSPRHNAFRDAVGRAWGNPALASRLIRITAHYKAPRGASAHHSGLTVDIDFPYATSNTHTGWHHMHRERNADASRSAAGRWLSEHARDYGFASYSTASEVWHLEWLGWRGTEADPAAAH